MVYNSDCGTDSWLEVVGKQTGFLCRRFAPNGQAAAWSFSWENLEAVPPGLFLWVSFSRAKSAGFLPLAEWGRMHFYRPSHDTSKVWLGEEWTSNLPSVVSEVTPNLLLGWVRGHHLPGVKPSLCKFPPTLFHGSALHPRCQRHQSLQL